MEDDMIALHHHHCLAPAPKVRGVITPAQPQGKCSHPGLTLICR
jgi:hypothetical protein